MHALEKRTTERLKEKRSKTVSGILQVAERKGEQERPQTGRR